MNDTIPGLFTNEEPKLPETDDEWLKLELTVTDLFSPHAPVNEDELFSGRSELIYRLLDVIYQRGLHAVLYGERGVGKTSLTYILSDRLFKGPSFTKVVRRQCTADHTFAMIWQNVFDEFTLDGDSADKAISDDATAYDIVRLFEAFPKDWRPVIVIDEFDRIRDPSTSVRMADTIKYLADTSSSATVIVVGVAANVADLFGGHGSIHRNLQQIRMPRMSYEELAKIVDDRAALARMNVTPSVRDEIIEYSQGLPGYTHLLGQAAFRNAIWRRSLEVIPRDLGAAMLKCINEADESVREAYATAVRSSQKNQYKEALLACALADTDEKGYFRAGALKQAFRTIVGKDDADVYNYSQNLKEFCKPERGPTLTKVGQPNAAEYRFVDALLRPYVIIKGHSDGLMTNFRSAAPAPSSVSEPPSEQSPSDA
jgi:Cdc6-like AAA superfamily ATPase